MQDVHPFGWLSLVPPLLVIVLAILTRRIIISLLIGIAVGSLLSMTVGESISGVISNFVNTQLWESLTDGDRMQVFAFTLLMGAMIGVINRSGAMRDLVNRLSVWSTNRRSGQISIWFFGLLIFFDDYANTMLLGTTMRSFCDRLKISREKLAYLVDSTAAPVAGLAIVSTWVAGEIDYVQTGLISLDPAADTKMAFGAFLNSIPYRFYVLWALLFVPMVALTGRDFGAMFRAEQDAVDGTVRKSSVDIRDEIDSVHGDVGNWINVVFPITITVAAIFAFMYKTGVEGLGADAADAKLYEIIGGCDPYASLTWGALVGFVTTALLMLIQRVMPFDQFVESAAVGARMMVPALAILWLASCLSMMTKGDARTADRIEIENAKTIATVLAETGADGQNICDRLKSKGFGIIPIHQALGKIESSTDQIEKWMSNAGFQKDEINKAANYPFRQYRLYTGEYLGGILGERVDVRWMPTIIFILASFVSFATGTSWGTMGIIMPLAIPLVYNQMDHLTLKESLSHPLMLASIGSVLSGAIFGDHCSPISDTTVLSSQASGCDHVAHVVTQMPYALTVGAIAVVCGTIPIGFGVPVWILLPIGVVVMLAALFTFGKRVTPRR